MDADGSPHEGEHENAMGDSSSGASNDADGSSMFEGGSFDADLFVDMPALGASYVGTMPTGGSSILQRNLDAIRTSCVRTAERIEQASPRTDIVFIETNDVCPTTGERVLSATIGEGDDTRALASKRRPLAEAEKLAAGFNINENGAAAILGFGLGHHAQAIALKLKKMGVTLCFEPDVALLRAVFEHIDHSKWMRETNFVIFTDPEGSGLIAARLKGSEPIVSLGTKFIHHTPSRPRLGKSAAVFSENLARVLRAIRTSLVTTLLQVEVTQRNLLQNLDHYATSPGVADLKDCCKGKPAIVVSAGPSLARNIHLLKQPEVQSRFVIVAAQTVLRQLLDEGITPHFVTALDYHEISKRFYEGLSAQDVEGVTLIAAANANPAILEAFPGQIRIPDDRYLTSILGEDLYTSRGELQPGATVAHLACYVARHLGCDPVILVGQDLGFTDGQYYGANAAIHRVWSGELNAFNTLEMMEWQRIVRGRHNLQRAKDVLGRPIYTDEQMLNYLTQFERDFLADSDRGLTVIDATEGGVAKRHTTPMSLQSALGKFMPDSTISIPAAALAGDPARIKAVHSRVRQIRGDIARVGSLARETKSLLNRMLDVLDDTPALNDLIRRVERLTARVMKLDPAYALVQQLNQNGALKRIRADREISLAIESSTKARQKLQIQRDRINVEWLADAADQLARLFDDASASLSGASKITRARTTHEQADRPDHRTESRAVWAVIPVDTSVTGLGVRRDLAATSLLGRNVLVHTLAQLAKTETISHVALLTDEPAQLAAIIGPAPDDLAIEYVSVPHGAIKERASAVAGARRWSSDCWRGGLGSLTCYDEVFDPFVLDIAMEALNIDAAVLLGPDWAMIDPGLTDEVVQRHIEYPDSHKIVFAQVPPGLAPCLVSRSLVHELANESHEAGVFATFGALVGYVPVRPQGDPIIKPLCVRTDPRVRDLGWRCVVDQPLGRRLLEHIAGEIDSAQTTPLDALAQAPISELLDSRALPAQLTLELTTRRLTQGVREQWCSAGGDLATPRDADIDWITSLIESWCDACPDAALTLGGRGDALLHPQWQSIVRAAKSRGAVVHLRTDLICDEPTLDALLASGVDVVSVDLLADCPQTYEAIAGVDRYEHVRTNIESLIERRPTVRGLPLLWVLPRITRCDATYEEIEPFFDHWLMHAGCAMIDALPAIQPGQRIEPLPMPKETLARRLASEMCIRVDGHATIGLDLASDVVCDVRTIGLDAAWQAVLDARAHANPESLSEPQAVALA